MSHILMMPRLPPFVLPFQSEQSCRCWRCTESWMAVGSGSWTARSGSSPQRYSHCCCFPSHCSHVLETARTSSCHSHALIAQHWSLWGRCSLLVGAMLHLCWKHRHHAGMLGQPSRDHGCSGTPAMTLQTLLSLMMRPAFCWNLGHWTLPGSWHHTVMPMRHAMPQVRTWSVWRGVGETGDLKTSGYLTTLIAQSESGWSRSDWRYCHSPGCPQGQPQGQRGYKEMEYIYNLSVRLMNLNITISNQQPAPTPFLMA